MRPRYTLNPTPTPAVQATCQAGKGADSKKMGANVSDCCWKTQAPRTPVLHSTKASGPVTAALSKWIWPSKAQDSPSFKRSSSTTTRAESVPLTSLILPRNCSCFTMRETPTSTWRRSDHNRSSSNHRWPRPTRHWVEGNDVQSPSCKVSNLGAAAVPWLSTQLEFQEVGTASKWWVPADSVHALVSCVLRVLSNGSSQMP